MTNYFLALIVLFGMKINEIILLTRMSKTERSGRVK